MSFGSDTQLRPIEESASVEMLCTHTFRIAGHSHLLHLDTDRSFWSQLGNRHRCSNGVEPFPRLLSTVNDSLNHRNLQSISDLSLLSVGRLNHLLFNELFVIDSLWPLSVTSGSSF
jgi:hypothetical protein